MKNIVFAGPTIGHAEIRENLDCLCLPPISHGDILRLLPDLPDAIGIIDGYFEGVPSVWHKEILYAIDQGVRVYGCSSMGALRAAELHPFGMIGVGSIFHWYRDELITDDDEVAVLHGPQEMGFLAASEPMVNIRASLELAEAQAIIDAEIKNLLLASAKNTFYQQRSWRYLLDSAVDRIIDKKNCTALKKWLDENRVNQKKLDALQMLQLMGENNSEHVESDFHFEWTQVWDKAYQQFTAEESKTITLGKNDQAVLDQLRLDADLFQHYRVKALLRWLSNNRVDIQQSEQGLQAALQRFRAGNQLDSRPRLLAYMEQSSLDEAELTRLLHIESGVALVQTAAGDLRAGIIDQLKLDGRYLTLLATARLKCSKPGSDKGADLLPPMLLAWYFGRQKGGQIPTQLEHHLARIDLDSSDEFYRLIRAEYLYWRSNQEIQTVEINH